MVKSNGGHKMRITMDKKQELLELVKLRKETKYDGYNSIVDYEDGFYECDYISPYSKSAHNVNADVFVVLQDWSSDENMHGKCNETNRLGYTPTVGTNIKLIKLLKEHLSLELKDTYATNLFPFIKMGGMSANIPIGDMRKSAAEFTLPMIKIIKPKVVIALGQKTFNALFDSCEEKYELTERTFKYGNTKVFHQPHPAARISNEAKAKGWKEMKEYLNVSISSEN